MPGCCSAVKCFSFFFVCADKMCHATLNLPAAHSRACSVLISRVWFCSTQLTRAGIAGHKANCQRGVGQAALTRQGKIWVWGPRWNILNFLWRIPWELSSFCLLPTLPTPTPLFLSLFTQSFLVLSPCGRPHLRSVNWSGSCLRDRRRCRNCIVAMRRRWPRYARSLNCVLYIKIQELAVCIIDLDGLSPP